jgi:riboflavin biosynthesis pyrimidine reductase
MGSPPDTKPPPTEDPPLLFRRLPAPGDRATAEEIVAGLELGDRAAAARAHRPYVVLNMVSTADGRATIDGRSAPLSGPADRQLFHGLRGAVDAVMAGAGTVRAERYGRIVPDEARRFRRRELNLAEEPLACIVSRGLDLLEDVPLLADPTARVAVLTPVASSLRPVAAHVEYVRAATPDGLLDLPAALAELRERLAVRTLLCEGGPHLAAQLLAAGLVDELLLSLSPRLAGGGTTLRILAGAELDPPVELELLSVLDDGESTLFLRYGVRVSAPGRVSRETMPSSSLAR